MIFVCLRRQAPTAARATRIGRLARRIVALAALAAPLGGCLEVIGHINRAPSAPEATPCPVHLDSHGDTVGYGCAPAAAGGG
jgi:hypothetical protein